MTKIVPVVSGKGGVGKSSVACNLAVALANLNYKVALIDSDFYGPSVPTLFGGGKVSLDHEGRLIPDSKYGVKFISLGFFLEHPDDAVIWRGPMFNKALNQMFNDVSWGEVDYFIVDMPPGTGDAQLSLSQLVKLAGAVIVTTPQEMALADVRKAINMLKKVNVPIIGIVENMAYFESPDGSKIPVFGEGGGVALSKQFDLPLLLSIPLDMRIRESGDKGIPIAYQQETDLGKLFSQLALKVTEILDKNTEPQGSLRVVN